MSQERRLAVLRAIVEDYVSTSEPVGSRALLERHRLGVSAATVRNDMSILEEEGLIHAPHTSAGRVPTDAGYRLFVDRLSEVKPLSRPERQAIETFLSEAVDLDDVVDRTVHLLATLTRAVAVMQYPSLTRSTVRHIEIVALGGTRAMVVLILTSGRVEQRVIDLGIGVDGETGESLLALMRSRINSVTVNTTLPEAARRLDALPGEFGAVGTAAHEGVRRVVRSLDEALGQEREERVVLAGTANLARLPGDFPTSIGPVLEALEEHVVLLKLMHTVDGSARGGDAIAVTIGRENPHEGLVGTSVVSTGYGRGTEVMAGLGVLGPTRMDYPSTMAAVRAVARYVSDILAP